MKTKNKSQQEIEKYLRRSELFADMDSRVLSALTPAPEWIEVDGKEDILVQGAEGEYFYMLAHGRLGVSVTTEDGEHMQVATIPAGEGVGEMSLLTTRPITATVSTLRDSALIRFSKATFDSLVNNHPDAALNITKKIIERLERTLRGDKTKQGLSTIVICATSESVSAGRFAERLSQALLELGNAISITEDMVPADDFGGFLHDVEEKHDNVLLICEQGEDEWRKICSRQADKTLLLASGDQPPQPLPELTDDPENTDLVLLHGEGHDQAGMAAAWREHLEFDHLHNMQLERQADYERLARILTGNANNLILSGGAAHSFAQIGVIKAIEEAGIPIDRVCGTSMGSLVAAQYSAGMDFDDMIVENRKIWAEGKPLSDVTLPATALVRGKRLQEMVREALGDMDIEDLPLQFSCVSTNLTRADYEFHQRGSLWRAVRASGTIPGIGPPLVLNGELLVDGGILSNLPVSVFKQHYNGNVIAVDVGLRDMQRLPDDWDDRVDSGWSLFWKRMNPFHKEEVMPSMMAILYRTATLGSASSDVEAKQADLYISLNLEEHNPLDFRLIDVISESGYNTAVEWLKETDLSGVYVSGGA